MISIRLRQLFIDFCAGLLRAFTNPAADNRFLGPSVSQASSFGQDLAGELYIMSLGGGVYRIDPAP